MGRDGSGFLDASRTTLLLRPGEDSLSEEQRAWRGRPLISSSVIGSANRGRVVQALFDLGPTSRAELARHAGVNRTTISGIVQPLINQGLLVEGEPVRSSGSGGKPARPLWFSADANPICAVLLMPDSVRSCLVTLSGHISAENEAALDPASMSIDAIATALVGCISGTIKAAPRPPFGIGVAVGGMVDTDAGSIVAVALAPVLNGLQVAGLLQRRFRLPAYIDHHPRAMLVGDRWFGQGRGARSFAAIYTGEVLGGALYIDGHVYRGPAGAGGELGHTFVQVDGDLCGCGRRGCWETIATLRWLRREAEAIELPNFRQIDSETLVALAQDNVSGATELLDRYARNVAVGIANLQQTMAPNYYVLHGDVARGGARFTDMIAAHVKQLVPQRPGWEMTFVRGDMEDRAALRGAAGIVLSELLQFPL